MGLEQPITFEFSLPSELGYERLVRQIVAWVGERINLTAARVADYQTAVSEACINAIEHGNRGLARLRVKVLFNVTHDHLETIVVDEGVLPFEAPDHTATIEEKLAGLASSRGMGLMLIDQLVDEAEFLQPEPGQGNRLRLRMYRS